MSGPAADGDVRLAQLDRFLSLTIKHYRASIASDKRGVNFEIFRILFEIFRILTGIPA
jgi:hypothetical protein